MNGKHAEVVEAGTLSCPIDGAMSIVGSRSSMLIVREAFYGTSRFDDFVERVGMAPATASSHLRALVETGVLQKSEYRQEGSRPRLEYTLTQAGRDLLPVVLALYRWGTDHAGVTPAVTPVHVSCSATLYTTITCTSGHDVAPDELSLKAIR